MMGLVCGGDLEFDEKAGQGLALFVDLWLFPFPFISTGVAMGGVRWV